MNKISTILGACSLSIFMTGCANNPENVDSELMMNQPSVADNVALSAPQKVEPVMQHTAVSTVKPELSLPLNDVTTTGVEGFKINTPTIAINSSVDESDVSRYVLMRGETYKSALNRWLYDEQYTKVGMLLNDEFEWKINQTVKQDEVIKSTFDNALITMKTRISENVKPEDTSLFTAGFEPLETVDPVRTSTLTFQLHRDSGEAIITTSILPVTLFEVQKGDLMTNYITMAHHYGWNAEPDFFLTANMESPFSYIIVTEEQNVRGAFEQLLKPYPSLRAGLYEPTRQIFIQDDK